MQTETHCGITALTDKELKEIIQSETDDMNFDKAVDFMYEVVAENKEELDKLKPIEKITWLVHCAYMGGFAKAFKIYNNAVRDTLNGVRIVNIDEIKIYPCFAAHKPKPEKMQRKEQYFEETGALQSQIILDSRGNLIDGYTSYLLARAHGIQCVPIRYGRRQIVRAYHKPGGKLYSWELPGLLIDRVSAGDMAIVHTERGVKAVTVAAVEEYAGNEPEPLRMVIRVKRKKP